MINCFYYTSVLNFLFLHLMINDFVSSYLLCIMNWPGFYIHLKLDFFSVLQFWSFLVCFTIFIILYTILFYYVQGMCQHVCLKVIKVCCLILILFICIYWDHHQSFVFIETIVKNLFVCFFKSNSTLKFNRESILLIHGAALLKSSNNHDYSLSRYTWNYYYTAYL